MNFKSAAYARSVLRALSGEKTAGLLGTAGAALGGAAKQVGKGVNWAWQKSMKQNGPIAGTIGLGLGAAGAYALGQHAINRTRAAYQGFSPDVQAYTRQDPY